MNLQSSPRSIVGGVLDDVQLSSRARQIKLVVSDWIGVLGDGQAYDQFSLRDGVGIDHLRHAGIRTAVIASEPSTLVARRSEAFGSSHVFVGVKDKAARIEMIADDSDIPLSSVAFIGASASDVAIMRTFADVGLTGAPRDAAEEIVALAHYRCDRSGGFGAFREFAEWILGLRAR